MSKNSFLKEAMYENHPQYQQAISRNEALYQRKNDLRSPFLEIIIVLFFLLVIVD